MSNILMFTIAMNGFDRLFKHHINSQRVYAQRMGFDYHVITRPTFSILGKELVWLKLTLMIKALEHGYDWVFFVDADAEVKLRAPNILHQTIPEKAFYLAQGFSGRLNSGVMLVKNTSHARRKIQRIVDNALIKLPAEDDVGWGENGHVLHYLKDDHALQYLSSRWNNNQNHDMNDYIRHYSHGPLYVYSPTTWYDLLWVKLLKNIQKVRYLGQHSDFHSALQDLTDSAVNQSTLFSTTLSRPTHHSLEKRASQSGL